MKQQDQIISWIIEDEGGYTEDHGLGGATNYGITFTLLREVCDKDKVFAQTFLSKEYCTKLTFTDLKNLSWAGAFYIYSKHVLPQVKFYELPPGLNYVMANATVMEGPTGATELLREELGIPKQGRIDKTVILKIENPIKTSAGVLIRQSFIKLHDDRVGKYGPGWANRLLRVWNRINK